MKSFLSLTAYICVHVHVGSGPDVDRHVSNGPATSRTSSGHFTSKTKRVRLNKTMSVDVVLGCVHSNSDVFVQIRAAYYHLEHRGRHFGGQPLPHWSTVQ